MSPHAATPIASLPVDIKRLRATWSLAAAGLAAACVMVPVTQETYDPACGTVKREVVLQPQMVGAIGGCVGRECSALLASMGLVTAASAVVSGSIAVVGNVGYWLEHKKNCKAATAAAPAASVAVPSTSGAATSPPPLASEQAPVPLQWPVPGAPSGAVAPPAPPNPASGAKP